MIEGGCFVVLRNQNEEYDIDFSLKEGIQNIDVPKIQMDLYKDIENSTNVIKNLWETKSVKKEAYFKKLLSLAQAGLVGDEANPYVSFLALDELKDEIVRTEGIRIKTRYMIKLGIWVLIYIFFFTILYVISKVFLGFDFISPYYFVLISSLVGSWFSFGVRKNILVFSDLSIIESDMMIPAIRLIFVGLASIIVLLFFQVGLISISIGSFTSDNTNTSILVQIVFGLCCGLIESNLGNVIYKKANSFIK